MDLKEKVSRLEKKIEEIEARNRRVEQDKAWETSVLRRIIIAVLTYFAVTLFFVVAGLNRPFINAIVPTTGFILSTLSISVIKRLWINSRK